jgi:hypothetical protein
VIPIDPLPGRELEPGYSGPTAFGIRPNRTYTTINSVLYARSSFLPLSAANYTDSRFFNPALSRGRTHIASSDPSVPPSVDPNYWGHPIDVAAQVGGIKLARRMLRAPPMDSIFEAEFEPGVQFQTDDEIEGWLRGVVASDNHEVGTLSMLPEELGGVVDTSLKVYGTSNVRVAGELRLLSYASLTTRLINHFTRCINNSFHDQCTPRKFEFPHCLTPLTRV